MLKISVVVSTSDDAFGPGETTLRPSRVWEFLDRRRFGVQGL